MLPPATSPLIKQLGHHARIYNRILAVKFIVNLENQGFKGCSVFDCLGAGQKVSQTTFHGQNWRQSPEISEKMFRVFPIMEQLYEMIAYVAEALSHKVDSS